ncbi:bifunctional diaminohydroxyphosphoribosylaminopyrimidine deaminase/5-amino-6-(5-phosphoribosylamino)uracil reductase RibD [Deferribacter autotrophicus]|uniref:Riboflavin biosynthesis protein RibD n=2 Tax=Deferribacter autotrophicus TaxID=500465 RepID=A0A5A8F979_9BACT|nr:bifunctional diaminohydroxyphosphoribosylaminopyrimidine deaminase/5-amino-6-(5-phosphoribosylamino)uracil reductase RibD [Deferribacter autotrophicus]
MKECVQLALLGKGKTKTNPTVGAVVVKNGRIIGRGYHSGYGNPHAEIEAMKDASEPLEGSDLYVTLEPCSHYGKTPPCVDAIIENKIKRVFIGVVDPNPDVTGKGIDKLIEAGIDVFVGFNEELCASIIEDFTKGVLRKEPYYTLKIAESLDGKIATKTGDSKWITSESSRTYVHFLRSISDAVLVGVNTVNKDNPRLDARMIDSDVNPYKVVLDPHLSINMDTILTNEYSDRLIVFTKHEYKKAKELRERGAKVFIDESEGERIDLDFVSKCLLEEKILNVFVEGGSETAGLLIDAGKIDRVYFFVAPKIIGGKNAITSVGGDGIACIKDANELKEIEIKRFEKDILITGKLNDYKEYIVKLTDKVRNRCSLGL